ncbi:MAG: hypothetical protein H6551_00505 [Chitinophagales bacterium]|nr:hypothetical protein [Chitinophagaceae bacterium]MCB9063602.1 hypothetical protein [Chitinophagales bacterium]
MRKLMTYPVGLVLKLYMAYAFYLVNKEERRLAREASIAKKPALGTA